MKLKVKLTTEASYKLAFKKNSFKNESNIPKKTKKPGRTDLGSRGELGLHPSGLRAPRGFRRWSHRQNPDAFNPAIWVPPFL